MTADSPTSDHLPRSPVTCTSIAAAVDGGVTSPRRHGVATPWTSVFRGNPASPPPIVLAVPEQSFAFEKDPMESSSPEAQPESSNVNGDGNAGRPRRHAWNTTVNGVVEPNSVMVDAVSWPALSESIRAVPRSSSEPFRPIPNGSASSSQGPIISQPPQRQTNTNAHVNSTVNNMPTKQRSRHRGRGAGGGSSSGNGPSSSVFIRPSPPQPPPFPVFNMPYAMVPHMLDTPVRGTRPGGGVGGSQPHNGNDSSPRNNSRRGNYGPRPRGDGPYHSNHGVRRDQDRRDVHLSHQYVPPVGYMPTPFPPGAPPFISTPPAGRVFPGQMGFDMSSPFIYVPTLLPESFRPMPIMPPPPPMLFATSGSLPSLIVKQIDYYFSDENLVKDNFLRSNMDDQGWVPITLIASFPRVQQLTFDVPFILDSLRNSSVVEVQGDKLRKRNEWKKWLHNAGWSNTNSGSHPLGASPENVLATSFQDVSLEDTTIDANGTVDG
ncbi:la-related protein 1B-like [Olea europaea var. sylvestris]|uniref:HTH La-type RNA-binding domain-containing protein n=1 Tax=Olea europaea subsp. europaea TaxID=158383 RepID=A0A8S0QKK0_OLEEU|nr:la-related protein 1B-like [Olea europaea var. sylvestris]CAA2968519.1 Hypothetical predicted protein [Olea europaea subsp. europaea]